MLNRIFKKANKVQSAEDDNAVYLCIGKKRFIFRDGKYVGWYKP